MRRALALATCVHVSARSTRDMAERHAAALGRGAMGSPRPSACSEKGVHTAPAKSPPRLARPTTACCAPFMPPGSGAISATATTIRTISQAPKPQRPVRAVSTSPPTVCQSRRKAGEHQDAAIEDEEHVAQHCVAGHVHVAQEAQQVTGRVIAGGEDVGVDGLRTRRLCEQSSHPETREPQAEGRERGAEHDAGTPLPLHQAAPAPSSAGHGGTRRHRGAPWHRGTPRCPVRKSMHASDETPGGQPDLAQAAADLGREEEAQDPHGHRGAAPGSVRPGKRRISSVASASRAASMAPRRSSSR